MELIRIQGGAPLCGTLTVQGSKNAALPVLAACILVSGITRIRNCPDILDTVCMCEMLRSVGADVYRKDGSLIVDSSVICAEWLPEKYATRMRSSVVLMGALLGRRRKAMVYYPGGCVIGDRPIDLHLKAMEALGARIEEKGSAVCACADKLKGGQIVFERMSVGATQNAVMAAVLAEGRTQIYGASKEPEIITLCSFLNGAGAKIYGAGTSKIEIEGVEALHGSEFEIPADRIAAGTYVIGALTAGGRICLEKAPVHQMESLLRIAEQMGAEISGEAESLSVECKNRLRSPGEIRTDSYPGFPTDLQSPMLTALCQAEGGSCIKETIFNGRFGVVEELNRMGADILVEKDSALIGGSRKLKGKKVFARELRGGAALVLAGLCAEGETLICNRNFIDRGYEDICRDLRKLGAQIDEETEI